MRYDDPARPKNVSADSAELQVSGSPLPVFTLIRPMLSDSLVGWRCHERSGIVVTEMCDGRECGQCCEQVLREEWGWLVCIHAHIESNRFGYHTAWIRSIDEFLAEYLEDPEAALAKYFKYNGPEERKKVARVGENVGDLFEGGEE